ncbi:MAG: glycerol kinase, partial [Clostridiales bacterium]|nr:glycerol kinase [Clostridiales bacterium]
KTVYALEGSIFNAGSAIDWLINNARLAVDVREINDFCDSTPDSNGVCFVPAFSGLGAPRWDAYARGVLCGLDLSATSRHIVRAVMEAIAYQTKDVFDAMEADTGLPITKLRVDGGVTKSNFVMQFQSDILNISVERPVNTELTALGASYLAGLAVGYYKDLNEIAALVKNDVSFLPAMASDKREKLYSNWLKAVERARAWVE